MDTVDLMWSMAQDGVVRELKDAMDCGDTDKVEEVVKILNGLISFARDLEVFG